MKFLHIADMHFDTPFKTLNSRGNFGEIRRLDQREIFKKIINYIKEKNIGYFFIAGDLYENEYIRLSTIEYINNLFKEIPETKIFITPGNHDPYINNSMYKNFNWNNNVKIFTEKIECIENENVDIYGVGFNDFYCGTLGVENIKIKNPEKINILIVHGALDGSADNYMQYNFMKKNDLKKLGFDYIALGHIHKPDYNSEENQYIVYPGSPISLGFDELGKHGIIIGNIEKNNLNIEFMPIDNREFKELELDVTNITQKEELIEKLNELNLEENNLYKIILIGKRNFEINIYELYKFITNKNIIKIKNNTKLNYNLEELANNRNLKGIFAQEILEELNKNNYDKNILENVLEIGLELLEKQ